MKCKFLKAPVLSTAFSEDKKSAKKRFKNIFDEKGKIGIAIVVVLILIIVISSMFISIKNNDDEIGDNLENNIKPDDLNSQINIIVDKFDTWKVEEFLQNEYNYAITDLDHNGRLEIIVASCQGTGIFTYGDMYEVNEERTGIYKIEDNVLEDAAWPDIIVNKVKVFYDGVNDTYEYIFDNFTRNGAAESYEAKAVWVLKDDKLNIDYIANKSTIYDENGVPTITCTNSEDKEISKEEYENIEDDIFKTLPSKIVSLKWLNYNEVFSGEENTDNIKDKLLDSYKNFNLEITSSMIENEERRKAYTNALNTLYYGNVLPDGTETEIGEGYEIKNNKFAILDIDSDGKEELVLSYTETYTAGQTGAVYEYDVDTKKMITELVEYPLLTFYNNGVVEALMSHNQGKAGDNFWPYLLYNYSREEDKYNLVAIVDAWDKNVTNRTTGGEEFPDDIDKNGDGMVYYVMTDGTYELNTPIDNAEYEEWRKTYINENIKKVEIPFVAFGNIN